MIRAAVTLVAIFAAPIAYAQSFSSDNLVRRAVERRAIEAANWGRKQSNWTPTKADGRFEVLFRLYGPQKPLFDRTWVLPDIEEMK